MVTAENLGYTKGQAQVFEGPYVVGRPLLEKEGFTLLSPVHIFRKRVEELVRFEGMMVDGYWTRGDIHRLFPWNCNDFDTDMGIAVTDREALIDPHSSLLRAVGTDTYLARGGIPLIEIPHELGLRNPNLRSNVPPLNRYPLSLPGRFVGSRSELRDDTKVYHSPFLKELTENDTRLLGDLVRVTYSVGGFFSFVGRRKSLDEITVQRIENPILRRLAYWIASLNSLPAFKLSPSMGNAYGVGSAFEFNARPDYIREFLGKGPLHGDALDRFERVIALLGAVRMGSVMDGHVSRTRLDKPARLVGVRDLERRLD